MNKELHPNPDLGKVVTENWAEALFDSPYECCEYLLGNHLRRYDKDPQNVTSVDYISSSDQEGHEHILSVEAPVLGELGINIIHVRLRHGSSDVVASNLEYRLTAGGEVCPVGRRRSDLSLSETPEALTQEMWNLASNAVKIDIHKSIYVKQLDQADS